MVTTSSTITARLRGLPGLAALIADVAIAGWTLLSMPAAEAAGDCTVSASEAANDAEEQRMLTLINQYRTQNGLST